MRTRGCSRDLEPPLYTLITVESGAYARELRTIAIHVCVRARVCVYVSRVRALIQATSVCRPRHTSTRSI